MQKNHQNNGLKVLSLCGGIETGLLALQQLGIPVSEYHTYEILPEAIAVSEHHFPWIVHHGDMIGEDFTKYKGFDLVLCGSCCFTKDTLVLTKNGYKPISEIKTGDYVLTHKNKYEKVVDTFLRESNDIYEINTMSSSKMRATGNHPFYVREKYRAYNSVTGNMDRKFKQPIFMELKDLTKDYYVGSAINCEKIIPIWDGITIKKNRCSFKKVNNLSKYMDNEDFWWIVGRFMGDGWVTEYNVARSDSKNKIIRDVKRAYICSAKNEVNDIENVLNRLGLKYLSIERDKTYEILINGTEIAVFLKQFGKGAANKHLTEDIINLPSDLLEKFLEGFLSADGCVLKNGFTSITTASEKLAFDLCQCIMKVYKCPCSVSLCKRPNTCIIEGRTVNQKDTYLIKFKKDIRKQDKAFYEDGYVWYPIRNIEKLECTDIVYNFEVENDNSYVVQNIIVHNCQSLSRVRIEDKNVNSGLKGKSSIFYEAVRAVQEIQPRWFMFENVVPSSEEDLQEMNKCLGVTGRLINSNLFSAQDRERYYWTNFEIAPLPKENSMVLKDIMDKNVPEKYFYKKNFSEPDMSKKVCSILEVNTMEMNKRIYNPDFKCCTLTCINGGYHEKSIMDGGRPRKLTEVEYERLQGLPDNYTNVEVNGKKLSYTKRCSLCGNGWTLPVIKHILGSLKELL